MLSDKQKNYLYAIVQTLSRIRNNEEEKNIKLVDNIRSILRKENYSAASDILDAYSDYRNLNCPLKNVEDAILNIK